MLETAMSLFTCHGWKRAAKLAMFIIASSSTLPIGFGQVALTTAQVAKKASPSVVVIQGKTDSGDVLGSGFIVSKDGKVVTNLHVIRDMKSASVQLANGETFDSVSVLATDERRDLAVVRVAGFNLPNLDLGNSDTLTVGEAVVIVGSPRGLEGTVTAGILSSVRDAADGLKVLQTDAAVNPGNSGGPLLNDRGQAIGVVSFILRSSQGLNFAVPINYVRGLLSSLHEPMSFEQMRRSLVGVRSAVQQSSEPSLKETLDWLKEKLPLGVIQYLRYDDRSKVTETVVVQTTAWSLDSCTVIIGNVRTSETAKGEERPSLSRATSLNDLRLIEENRNTVPLGLLTAWFVEHEPNETNALDTFVSGERMGYRLYLSSSSKSISRAISYSTSQVLCQWESCRRAYSTDTLNMIFGEESLARRVAEAFRRASDICRKGEAF